jgi:hypothetical protein
LRLPRYYSQCEGEHKYLQCGGKNWAHGKARLRSSASPGQTRLAWRGLLPPSPVAGLCLSVGMTAEKEVCPYGEACSEDASSLP